MIGSLSFSPYPKDRINHTLTGTVSSGSRTGQINEKLTHVKNFVVSFRVLTDFMQMNCPQKPESKNWTNSGFVIFSKPSIT